MDYGEDEYPNAPIVKYLTLAEFLQERLEAELKGARVD